MGGISTSHRRDSILELLKENGKVSVSQLTDMFHISDVTIRSDLAGMEQAGLLRRVHGGAVSTKRAYYEMSLSDRMEVFREEKIRIAKACASLIQDGDTLMIGAGTTCQFLAGELAERENLTVVTNSLKIAQELVCNRSVSIILPGGNLDLQYQLTFGNDATSQLKKYRADKAIIGTDGIGVSHGLTTCHHKDHDVSRLMIERSNEVIILADQSKIGKEGFSNITGISSIDILITNECAANKAELDAIRGEGIEVTEV